MNPKTKFNLKIFFYHIFVEEWTEKINIPNIQTILLTLLVIVSFLRNFLMIEIALFLLVIYHGFKEYQSGKYIYEYRKKRYPEFIQARKKIKEEKEETNDIIPDNTS